MNTQKDLTPMLSYCHMFDTTTRIRMHSIPCTNLEIAMDVAYGQPMTINIVQSEGLTVGWQNGKTIFAATEREQLSRWMRKLELMEAPFLKYDKRRKKSGKK